MTVSSVSPGHAAANPKVGGGYSSVIRQYYIVVPRSAKLLTGQVIPRSQGDRQPLNFRISVGRETSEEPIREHNLIPNYIDNVLHATTVPEKRISDRG